MPNLPTINTNPDDAWRSGFLGGITPQHTDFDTQGVNTLSSQRQQANGYANNPLQSPAAASSMAAIYAGANRRKQMATGGALTHAAQSGQAGFAGAMQNTGAGIEEQSNSDIIAGQAGLAGQLNKQYGDQATQLAGQEANARGQLNQQKSTEKQSNVEDQLKLAAIQQQQEMQRYSASMEAARIAESARQFDASLPGMNADNELKKQQLELYRQGMSTLSDYNKTAGRTAIGPYQIK